MVQWSILWLTVIRVAWAADTAPSTTTAEATPAAGPTQATVPLLIDDDRSFIELKFTRPDGSARLARTWVDTGGVALIVTENLARDLGLDLTGPVMEQNHGRYVAIKPPRRAQVGDMRIRFDKHPMVAVLGQSTILPGAQADCFISPLLLKDYDVVLDYPAQQFTLAKAGTLQPRGERLITPVDPRSGLVRLELTIGGHAYGVTLDSGAPYTMLSQAAIDGLVGEHPDWPRLAGAVGSANLMGGSIDAGAMLVRVPELAIGAAHLAHVGIVSRATGNFEEYISKQTTTPVVGALAGNVLRACRVQIDFAHGFTYLEATGQPNADPTAMAGLIVQPNPDGSFLVAGVARKDGKSVIEGVAPGDRLLQIDDLPVTGKLVTEVVNALHGNPGEIRHLVLERNGQPITVAAPVVRLL